MFGLPEMMASLNHKYLGLFIDNVSLLVKVVHPFIKVVTLADKSWQISQQQLCFEMKLEGLAHKVSQSAYL